MHSILSDTETIQHLETYGSHCTVHTQVGEAVVAPNPHPWVTHAAPWGLPSKWASRLPLKLLINSFLSSSSARPISMHAKITKHSTMVTLRMLQLDQYKCFMEVTLTHDSVHIKRPRVSGTLHPSVTTKHCMPSCAIASVEIVKWVQSKCNSCCIEHPQWVSPTTWHYLFLFTDHSWTLAVHVRTYVRSDRVAVNILQLHHPLLDLSASPSPSALHLLCRWDCPKYVVMLKNMVWHVRLAPCTNWGSCSCSTHWSGHGLGH